jgi:peroxiredoxin
MFRFFVSILLLFSLGSCAYSASRQVIAKNMEQNQLQKQLPQEFDVNAYLKSIEYNPTDTVIARVNALIMSAPNKEVQAQYAQKAFAYFYKPNIMGQEAVSVAVAQEWFLSKKLEWPSKDGYFMLQTFVNFNKHSLVGMKAPKLVMQDTQGDSVDIYSLQQDYTILFFYTDDCPNCKSESEKLVAFLNEYKAAPIDVYAVYTQSDSSRWHNYIKENFNTYNPFVNWVNVWDKDYTSNFVALYNVIKTPQMYLLDNDKTILGRGLNVDALAELLNVKNRQKDDLVKFIDKFFSPLKSDSSAVKTGIDLFYNNCKDKDALFKELFRELYLYLSYSPDYNLSGGAVYLAEKYIIGMPEKWEGTNMVASVEKAVKVYYMNPIGKPAADLSLERVDGSSVHLYDMENEYKVLFFYKPNCAICTEMAAPHLKELYKKYRPLLDIEFVAINTSTNKQNWINYVLEQDVDWVNVCGENMDNKELFAKYYLEEVPAIYLLKNNVVVAKNINDIDLEEILILITQPENK